MMRTLTRGIAVLTIAEAGLLLLLGVAPLLLLDAGDSPVAWVRDSAWPVLSVLAFAFTGVVPFILLGLYTCEIEEMGALGLTGLVIALIGLLPYIGFQFDMAFVWPVLVATTPELVDFAGPMFRDPRFALVHFWMGPVYSIGVLVFGIAMIRARVFPRAASVLLTVGMILVMGILFPPFVLRTMGAVLSAPALGWMGLVLWSKASERSPAAASARLLG
jgi:hypothetical protein